MRRQYIFAAFLLIFAMAAAPVASIAEPQPSGGDIIARKLEQDAQRQALFAGYSGMRRYVLENDRMHKHAEMLVRVDSDAQGTKHFEVVDQQGWKAAYKHVLRRMLDTEAETSRPEIQKKTRLSADNYEFQLVRSALLGDRMTYEIDVIPRRREECLFEGRIWIDSQDFALVRAEGKPAKSPSVWVRSVHFVHTYQKKGPLWLPTSTESVTEVRVFGSSTLTINYFDFTLNPPSSRASLSVNSAGEVLPNENH